MNTTTQSPDSVMAQAAEGRLTKAELARFLSPAHRQRFLDACAQIEKKFTEDCTAKNEPCLESGCSAQGEVCLQPLLHAGLAYPKACAAAWLPIFREPKNRAEIRTP